MRYGCQFKMGLTGLKRSVRFAHLPFFSRSLDLSYFSVSDVFMKSTLFWVIRARLFHHFASFHGFTFMIYLHPIFLPGHCRFFTMRKNTDLLVDTCRPPKWILAPSAEGVITFGDLAFVCHFGKIKFSLTFCCCASPLFPFSLAVLCDTP